MERRHGHSDIEYICRELYSTTAENVQH